MQFIDQGEPADRAALAERCVQDGATLTNRPHWYCPDDPDAVVVVCQCGHDVHTMGSFILRFGIPCSRCRDALKDEFDEIIKLNFK